MPARSTGRTWSLIGLRSCFVAFRTCRAANSMARAASSPGTIENRIARRTPTMVTNINARSGPTMAPRLSAARSNPYARPYADGCTTSARIALREGPRIPRAAQAPVRNTPTCQAAVASPTALESTAVTA